MSADVDSLLPPNSPKEFELLCQHVVEDRFATVHGHAYGGPGSAQHGVDFYIEMRREPSKSEWIPPSRIIGVQCKHKDRLTRHKLTISELKGEVEKARAFRPSLTTFILATSSPTVKSVQDYSRQITQSHFSRNPRLFAVEVWFWEKIRHEFSKEGRLLREIIDRFYPALRNLGRSAAPPRILPKRAQYFTGRVLEIGWTKDKIASESRVALTGPGGIGKTAIACEAIRELSPDGAQLKLFPGGIFLHDFYSAPTYSAAIGSILAQAGLGGLEDREREPRARALLAESKCLVYLEGCEKAQELQRFLDLAGPSTVLLTSRRRSDSKNASFLNIAPLLAEDAVEVLRLHVVGASSDPKLLPGAHAKIWEELAKLCGCHALALRLAGHRLGLSSETPEEFKHILQTEGLREFDDDRRSKESLEILFAHSATELSYNARRIWFTLSLHAHAPLHLEPIAAILDCDNEGVRRDLREISYHSLVDSTRIPDEEGATEPAWLLSHALLSEWGANRLQDFEVDTEELTGRWMAWWTSTMTRWCDGGRVPGGPDQYAIMSDHLSSLIDFIKRQEGGCGERLMTTLRWVGNVDRSMGRYSAAKARFGNALDIAEQILHSDHPDLLSCLNDLAGILHQIGELEAAEPLHRQALAARERILGSEDPETLKSLVNLGVCLKYKGDLEGAEPLYKRAMEARLRTLGQDHQDTLASTNNFGNLLKEMGDLSGAEIQFRRALDACQRGLEPEHPYATMILSNLADVLMMKDDLVESEPLCLRAIEIRKRTLGSQHPDTLCTFHILAQLLEKKGEFEEAEDVSRRVLDGFRKSLMPGHPWLEEVETFHTRIKAGAGARRRN